MGTTIVDLHTNLIVPHIHHPRLVNNQPNEGLLLLQLVLVLNNVLAWRCGRKNFIPPFVKDGLQESLLSSNLFPTKHCQV